MATGCSWRPGRDSGSLGLLFGPRTLLQGIVSLGHLLLELLVGALAIEVLHPLAWTGLLEQLTEALAGGGHLLPAGAAVLGSVLVQTLPVLVPVAPALGALSFVRETHIPAAWGSDFSMVLPNRFPVTWGFFHSSSLSMGIRLNLR